MKEGAKWKVPRGPVTGAAAAVAAGSALPAALSLTAEAAEETHTMVIAAPATPQSLDHEFDVSLGTIDSVGGLYDNLLEYEKVPDNNAPEALREDISVHTDRPYNLALKGNLAENWQASPDLM